MLYDKACGKLWTFPVDGQRLRVSSGVQEKTVNEPAFPAEMGYGFVCLLMFQAGVKHRPLFIP